MAEVPRITPHGAGRAANQLVSPLTPQPAVGITQRAAGLPARALAGVGEALADLGTTLDQIEADNRRREELNFSVQAEEEFKRGASELLAGLDSASATYSADVREGLDELEEAQREQLSLTDVAVQSKMDIAFTRARESALTAAALARRNGLAQAAKETMQQALETTLADIRLDPDGEVLHSAQLQEQFETLLPNIPPGEREAMAEKVADAIIRAKVEGLAGAGRFDEALAMLKELGGELSPDQSRNLGRLINEIRNNQNTARLSRTAAETADIEIFISDAASVMELGEARQRIDDLEDQGFFEGRQGTRASLIKQINSRSRAIITTQNDLNAGMNNLANGLALENKKQANAVWENVTSNVAEADGTVAIQQKMALLRHFAQTAGMLPTEIQHIIASGDGVTDNDETLGAAAVMHNLVTEASEGRVDTGAGPKTTLTAQYINVLGLTPEQAASRVNAFAPDAATTKVREDAFAETFTNPPAEILGDESGIDEDIVTPAQEAAFGDMLKLFWTLSGDEDMSKKSAVEAFNRRFQMSSVGTANEDGQLMEFPPEITIPAEFRNNLTVDQYKEIIDIEIGSSLIEFGVAIPGEVERRGGRVVKFVEGAPTAPPFSLISDENTKAAVAAGETPNYEVRVLDQFGVMVPVPGLRYTPPSRDEIAASPTFQGIVTEQEEEARRIKRAQEIVGEAAITGAELAFEEPIGAPSDVAPAETELGNAAKAVPENSERIAEVNPPAGDNPIADVPVATASDPLFEWGRFGRVEAVSDEVMNALMMQESGGDAGAVNARTGATGAYQIMKATALDPGYGVTPLVINDTVDERTDPVKARKFARQYLEAMLRNTSGDLDLALAAYNWGLGNVRQLLDRGRLGQRVVPTETQNYIPGIHRFLEAAKAK